MNLPHALPIRHYSSRLLFNLRANGFALSLLLFLQCFVTFVAVPLIASHMVEPWLMDVCMLAFALVCCVSFTTRRSVQVTLLCSLAAITLGPTFWKQFATDYAGGIINSHETIAIAAFLFNLLITVLVARQSFGGGKVTGHRILGAVLIYLNVAVLFSISYDLLDTFVGGGAIKAVATGGAILHGHGTRLAEFSYFSLSTITTGNFGDYLPVHPFARSLANMEAVFGQLFPATFVARLVALHLVHSQNNLSAANAEQALRPYLVERRRQG